MLSLLHCVDPGSIPGWGPKIPKATSAIKDIIIKESKTKSFPLGKLQRLIELVWLNEVLSDLLLRKCELA